MRTRLPKLMVLTLLGACSPSRVVDVSQLDDGLHLLTVVSDGELAVDGLEVRVLDGQLESPVYLDRAEGEVWALRVQDRPSDRGEVRRVQLLARTPPKAPTYALEGTKLRVATPGVPDQFAAKRYAQGVWRPVAPHALETAVERATLVRTVETEPCPAPYGPLEPFIPDQLHIFEGLPGWHPGARTVALYELSDDRLLAVGERGIMLLRGRNLATTTPGPGPKDYLQATEFDPPARLITGATRLDPTHVLVAGVSSEGGHVWQLEHSEAGLVPLPGTAVGRGWLSIDRDASRIWVGDETGAVFSTASLGAAWRREVDGVGDLITATVLSADPLGVAHVRSGFLAVVADPPWPRQLYFPPFGASHSIETVRWGPEGELWAGFDGGEIAAMKSPDHIRWSTRVPARIQSCQSDTLDYSQLHLSERIRDIAFDEEHVFVIFTHCDAVWVARRSDYCPGLVLPDEGPPRSRTRKVDRLLVGEERLFVAGHEGMLLVAERRPTF